MEVEDNQRRKEQYTAPCPKTEVPINDARLHCKDGKSVRHEFDIKIVQNYSSIEVIISGSRTTTSMTDLHVSISLHLSKSPERGRHAYPRFTYFPVPRSVSVRVFTECIPGFRALNLIRTD